MHHEASQGGHCIAFPPKVARDACPRQKQRQQRQQGQNPAAEAEPPFQAFVPAARPAVAVPPSVFEEASHSGCPRVQSASAAPLPQPPRQEW